jgi:hypothetical protein
MAGIVQPGSQPFNDVDGPDCDRFFTDMGDAPEQMLAYPAVMGLFPTCRAPGPAGAAETDCAPVSAPPGAVNGWIDHHSSDTRGYWLGCFSGGVDSEADGKTNQPVSFRSVCSTAQTTDCVETAPWGMRFDQDECFGDGRPEDATLRQPVSLMVCTDTKIPFTISNCATTRRMFLNVCVDMNHDGDWNDNFRCPDGVCAYEWAVRNLPLDIPGGCSNAGTPGFRVGPISGPSWMRITISDNGVGPDYPWNGSASATVNGAAGWLWNGETEDYPIMIYSGPTPTRSDSWGVVKIRYR